MKPIKNRKVAGQLLATKLKKTKWQNTIVLALPRGGVPVAWEVAKMLELPWDVLLVKKIGAPRQPELAIGAVSEDKQPIWNEGGLSLLKVRSKYLENLVTETQRKILQQTKKWRKDRRSLDVKGKTVIVVDDGLATGMTMRAAVEFLIRRGAHKIVIAVPVASKSARDSLEEKVEQIVVLQTPEPFFSVGQWYEDFTQVSDETVTKLLANEVKEEQSLSALTKEPVV